MEQSNAIAFLEEKGDFLFPNKEFSQTELLAALMTAPDDFVYTLQEMNFINPTVMLGIAVIGGPVALDRFIMKKIGSGILKIITAGGFGVWTFADIFTAKKRCREYNCKLLIDAISDPSKAGEGIKVNVDVDKVVNVAKAAAPGLKAMRKAGKEFSNSLDAEQIYRYR